MTKLCASWIVEADLPETCDTAEVEPDVLTAAMLAGSEVIFNLTQRKYVGECDDEWHPLGPGTCWASAYTPVLVNGGIVNVGACGCRHDGIALPGSPVTAVAAVTVGGDTLPANAYRLVNRRYLQRVDGELWPCVLSCAPADDAFVIEYSWGRAPTGPLKRAAAILAWQFALAWTPSCAGQCQLPRRVQTQVRQGTTFVVIDPMTLFKDGLTGIADVDLIVQAHLRGEAQARASVSVPGRSPRGARW